MARNVRDVVRERRTMPPSSLSVHLSRVREEIWLMDVCNRWYVMQLYPSAEDRRLFNKRVATLREIRREIAHLGSALRN